MKIVNIPTPVFEYGDRVLTPEGMATVLHDELENIEIDIEGKPYDNEVETMIRCRQGVIVKLDEQTSDHDAGEDVPMDRELLIYKGHK